MVAANISPMAEVVIDAWACSTAALNAPDLYEKGWKTVDDWEFDWPKILGLRR